jgi:hypothetical protein
MLTQLAMVAGTEPPTVTMGWRTHVALGRGDNMHGLSVNGTRSVIGSSTPELWAGVGTTRVLPDLRAAGAGVTRAPSAGGDVTVVSSSVLDTVAGLGANTVLVSFIQAETLFERFGIAELDGATPAPVLYASQDPEDPLAFVQTADPVEDAVRITGAWVLTAGGDSNAPRETNAGTISVRIAAPATEEQHAIAVGAGAANGAFFTVPRGFYAVLRSALVSSSSVGIPVLRVVEQRWSRSSDGSTITGLGSRAILDMAFAIGPLELDEQLPPLTDVWATALNPSGADVRSSAKLDYVLIQDPADIDPSPLEQPPRFG